MEKLRTNNPKILLDYIKSSIDILINTKVEERITSHLSKNEIKDKTRDYIREEDMPINEYESALRHLEAEIRNHIRVYSLIYWYRLNTN